ncbi:MAG: hypothetical protein IJ436_04285 [Bacteroidaceae bacterium]|nr:hypothetical protein [Bacteroidaceae bacterium]
MKNILCLITVLLLLSSCSSPESEGKALAQKMNECAENYIKEKQKVITGFVEDFNASDYSSRAEALKAYEQVVLEVLDEYNSRRDEILVEKDKIAGQFADDYNDVVVFRTTYLNNINTELNARLLETIADTECPEGVLAMVKSVVPNKPDVSRIQKDLVGHKLYEGFERKQCFFPENWAWNIEKNEI